MNRLRRLLPAGVALGVLLHMPAALGAQTMDKMDKMDHGSMEMPVMGMGGHNAGGHVSIAKHDGRAVVRFSSDFRVDRGDDLYVALSKTGTLAPGSIVVLGKLGAVNGARDLAIPASTNAADYPHVIVYSKKSGAGIAMAHATKRMDKMGMDKMGMDKMDKDKMGTDKMDKMDPRKP